MSDFLLEEDDEIIKALNSNPKRDGKRLGMVVALDGYFRENLKLVIKAEAKKLVEWLEGHCRGYHKGNHGGEFGHFGIYRSEIEAIKKEVEDG